MAKLLSFFFIIFLFFQIKSPQALAADEMIFFAQDAKIAANEKAKTIVVFGGNMEFAGECEELVVLGGSVKILSTAKINKSLVLLAGNIQQDAGAKVAGDRVIFQAPDDFPKTLAQIGPYLGLVFGGIHWLAAALGWVIFQWIGGIFLQKFLPEFWLATQNRMDKEKGRNALGFVFYILLFVPFLLSLIISIVGILFIPFFLFYYFLVYLFGTAVGAAWLGRKIPPLTDRPMLALLVGLFIFLLLKATWYGAPIAFVFQILGSGAFFLQTYHSLFKRSA
jgi:hypothetical protein